MTYTVKNVHKYHNKNLKKIEIIVLLLDKKRSQKKKRYKIFRKSQNSIKRVFLRRDEISTLMHIVRRKSNKKIKTRDVNKYTVVNVYFMMYFKTIFK